MSICKYCEKEFEKHNHNQIYCCLECRETDYLEKREEKNKAEYVVFRRDHFRCVYCGKSPIEDGVKLVIEHVYPRCGGGDGSLYNVVTACMDCNSAKLANLLPHDVYMRIIRRNIRLNKGLSPKKRHEIKLIIDKLYPSKTTKGKHKRN
jgi:hypothetical protein